jgi:hypothetical protein
MLIQDMIVSSPEQPSLLHVLSSLMFATLFYVNRVNNDDVHQSPKIVFHDKDIHSSSSVVKEKVGNLLLNMCSVLQNNNPIVYHRLLCIHSHKGTEINGYLNCQWFDHNNFVKDGQS